MNHGRRGIPALGWLLFAASCVSLPCLAQPTTDAVDVVLVGSVGDVPAISNRVTSWFDSSQFAVTVRRVQRLDPASVLSPKPERGVSAWVVLRDPKHARFYFASASGADQQPTYLVRDLDLERGLGEVGAEHLAQVLYLSTVALLDGQATTGKDEVNRVLREERDVTEQAVSTAPPPTPIQTAPPAKRDQPSVEAELSVGYGASWRGDEGLWHGPWLGVGVRIVDTWGVQLVGQGALPSSSEVKDLELRFYGASLGLLGSYRYRPASGIAVEGHAGPGVEIVHYEPIRSLEPGVNAEQGETEARPSLLVGMNGVFRESAPRLIVTAQCMVSLTHTRYYVVAADSRREVGRSELLVPSLGVMAQW